MHKTVEPVLVQSPLNETTVESPLVDGIVYSKTSGVCPCDSPFSVSPLEDYMPIIGEERMERLVGAAKMVEGLKVLELNSCAQGGGVAEMLLSSVPFLNQLGIDNEWRVIRGTEEFFEVTKCIHNILQGREGNFTSQMEKTYFRTIDDNTNGHMMDLNADIITIHDPQPLGLIPNWIRGTDRKGKWLWRCHIDMDEETLKANSTLQYFIDYWVGSVDAAIFSTAQYVICRWPFPKFIVPPYIDPLSAKNRKLTSLEIENVLSKLGIDRSLPIIAQIGRFDPWKGLDSAVDVYKRVKEKCPCQLLLAGGFASDDPEGQNIFNKISQLTKDDPDIHVICLPPTSNHEINALQRASQVILQLSIKEGFGLTVTEALWKGKPVIATPVGGITQQLRDQEYGFFHTDIGDTADNIVYLLTHPRAAELMGRRGHLYVKDHFLMPDRVTDYLKAIYTIQNSKPDPESIISFHSWHKLDKRK